MQGEHFIIKPKWGKMAIEEIMVFSREYIELNNNWVLVNVDDIKDIPYRFKAKLCADGVMCPYCEIGVLEMRPKGDVACDLCGADLDVWEQARSSWKLKT